MEPGYASTQQLSCARDRVAVLQKQCPYRHIFVHCARFLWSLSQDLGLPRTTLVDEVAVGLRGGGGLAGASAGAETREKCMCVYTRTNKTIVVWCVWQGRLALLL